MIRRFLLILRLSCAISVCAVAGWTQSGLADASIEQLLDIQVTTVSKKEQSLARTAAAVFVLGAEDIRRSGAQNVPDLLRLVPGVQVAQIDANAWAISIRGFNSRYSNKVLVLIDGRAVYNPTFSGVYWDQVDLPLEDIERIEVIRGPGATVWGANAVNGVINIITSTAKAGRGGLASVAASSNGSTQELLQYGGAAGASGDYRIFTKYSRFGQQNLPYGDPAGDAWSRVHSGLRSDWVLGAQDNLTVQGDWFRNREGQTRSATFLSDVEAGSFADRVYSTGGNFLARWTHVAADGATTELRGYYDTYRRTDLGSIETAAITDLDVQHHFAPLGRHDIVAGGGFRTTNSAILPGSYVTLTPANRTAYLLSGFVQDEIRLTPTLWLTVGSKFEQNSAIGFDYEPSARLAWTPAARHSLWATASRAVRQPSRVDQGLQVQLATVPVDPQTVLSIRLSGNANFRSEVLHDYEAGYRVQWTSKLSLDATAYLSFYRDLETLEPQPLQYGPPALPFVITQPVLYSNTASARNYGGEAALNWTINNSWRLAGTYSVLHLNPQMAANSQDTLTPVTLGASPRNQVGLRSQTKLSRKLEWDQTFAWVERTENTHAPAQFKLDSRLGWSLGEKLQLSIVGQNLCRAGTIEFGDSPGLVAAVTQRTVFGRISWMF